MNRTVHTIPDAPPSRLRPAAGLTGLALVLHGLIHLIGVTLLLELGEPGDLTYAAAHPEPGTLPAYVFAGLWMLAAVLFVSSGYLVLRDRARIGTITGASVVSLIAIAPMASSAPIGLAISVGTLLGSFLFARVRG